VSDGRDVGDERLVDDFLRGEPTAIRTIDRWIERVLSDGFASLRDQRDDLRQEVRLRLFTNLRAGRFRGHSQLRTYVHRIAKNTCIDLERRAYRQREHSLGPAGYETEAGEQPGLAADASELLRRLLAGLSEPERRLIELVFVERLSYAEIATVLGVSEGTVKSRVSRFRERLSEKRRELTSGGQPARPAGPRTSNG
jgi:RNA polymerase sigma-70 factor, ECF subfamily